MGIRASFRGLEEDSSVDRATAELVAAQCACFVFRKTVRRVTQTFDRSLAPLGVRSTQLVVLVLLAKNGPLRASDLAEETSMDPTSFSRLAGVLSRNGWIRRATGEDKRVRTLALTPKGHRLLDRAAPYWQEAQGRVVGALGSEYFDDVRRRFDALVASLAPEPAARGTGELTSSSAGSTVRAGTRARPRDSARAPHRLSPVGSDR